MLVVVLLLPCKIIVKDQGEVYQIMPFRRPARVADSIKADPLLVLENRSKISDQQKDLATVILFIDPILGPVEEAPEKSRSSISTIGL